MVGTFGLDNVLLQERRKYGALGWNCAHAFNITDLEAGMMMAHILLRDSPAATPWTALQQAIMRLWCLTFDMFRMVQPPVLSTKCFCVTVFQTRSPLYCKPVSRALQGNFVGARRSGAGWVQVLGGIVYGGRITDTADVHVLVALLRRFLRPELMNDNFSFASDRVYSRPPVGSLQSYRCLPVTAVSCRSRQLACPFEKLQCMYITIDCA